MAAKNIMEPDIEVRDCEEYNNNKIRKCDWIHIRRLNSDLTKEDKDIEAIIWRLSYLDKAKVNSVLENLNREWLYYQDIYSKYTEQITNTITSKKKTGDLSQNKWLQFISIQQYPRALKWKHPNTKAWWCKISSEGKASSTSSKRLSASSKGPHSCSEERIGKVEIRTGAEKDQSKAKTATRTGTNEESPSRGGDKNSRNTIRRTPTGSMWPSQVHTLWDRITIAEKQLVQDPIDSLVDEPRDPQRSLQKGRNS